MEGIRILAETPIYITEYVAGWSWLGFSLGIAALFFIVGTIILVACGDSDGIFLALVSIFLIFGSFFCFKTDNLIENFDYMEYKVLISEEVNFIEFNQKYEIIEQEGEIFTIKERVSNDDKAGM